LGKIASPRAVPGLITAAHDVESNVRANAAEALGKIGDPLAVGPLCKLLKDDTALVRVRAAEALGRIGDQEAALTLIRAIRDQDSMVRAKAVQALGAIGDKHGKDEAELVPCPYCKKQTRKEKTQLKKLHPALAWVLLIVGFALTPFLIGIPIVLIVSEARMKKQAAWVCEHCRHVFELNWYEVES